MTTKMKMYRQGDLLLIKVDNPDPHRATDRRVIPDGVLLYGEATGHAHRILDGTVFDYRSDRYVLAGQRTRLVHDEHDVIQLPEGIYRVRRQREWDENSIREVTD